MATRVSNKQILETLSALAESFDKRLTVLEEDAMEAEVQTPPKSQPKKAATGTLKIKGVKDTQQYFSTQLSKALPWAAENGPVHVFYTQGKRRGYIQFRRKMPANATLLCNVDQDGSITDLAQGLKA